jgi:hypothetical protein
MGNLQKTQSRLNNPMTGEFFSQIDKLNSAIEKYQGKGGRAISGPFGNH